MVDTLYFTSGYVCKGDPYAILKNAAANGYTTVVESGLDSGIPSKLKGLESGISALSIGDEVDGNLKDTNKKWKKAIDKRLRIPEIPTYQGGKTSRQCGLFAGITDIQAKDFYVAGCAPHITEATSTMRIQGAFDFLKNTRDNHMPLTTWGYSQFEHSWNTQPNANEVNIQVASVFASGMKGLMLFQIDMSKAGSSFNKDTKKVMKIFKNIRAELRIADVDAVPFTKDDDKDQSIVTVLRSPNKLIVIAINTKADGYNDLLCYTGISNHWSLHSHGISNLRIDMPDGFQFKGKWQEVTENGIENMSTKHTLDNNHFLIQDISLDKDLAVRVYLIE